MELFTIVGDGTLYGPDTIAGQDEKNYKLAICGCCGCDHNYDVVVIRRKYNWDAFLKAYKASNKISEELKAEKWATAEPWMARDKDFPLPDVVEKKAWVTEYVAWLIWFKAKGWYGWDYCFAVEQILKENNIKYAEKEDSKIWSSVLKANIRTDWAEKNLVQEVKSEIKNGQRIYTIPYKSIVLIVFKVPKDWKGDPYCYYITKSKSVGMPMEKFETWLADENSEYSRSYFSYYRGRNTEKK